MTPTKRMPLTRAQKIINKVICQRKYSSDLNIEDENQNKNNGTDCPVSPLPSGAEYAVEDLSFDLLTHTNLQITSANDVEASRINDSNETVIIPDTPIPSSTMSFSAYSAMESDYENMFAHSDHVASTPEPRRPFDNLYESPSSVISSDLQSIPSTSEPAVYSSNEVFSPASKNRKKKFTKRKDIGRLRQRYQKEWVDIKRKRLKNLGLQYHSRDGKLRREKSLGALKCYPKCAFKCFEKFTDSDRQKIFDKFWAIGNHSKQWDVLAQYVQKINKRRTITDADSRRTFTNIYYLPVLNSDSTGFGIDNEQNQRVCKTTFLQTFAVSEKVVRTALAKKASGFTSTDQRGYHSNHPVVITDAMIESVRDHVKSFEPVESHYCRKDTNKLYLDGSLTFRRMYTMYNEWFDHTKYSSKCGSMRQYRDIVNKNFNLGFHKPKKDLCDTCHTFKTATEPTEDMKLTYSTHLSNKNLARSLKAEDKKIAGLNRDKVFCACYDMQKILYCPQGDVSLFYYKMKLKLYNFTAFDVDKLQGFCYLWSEQDGKKGPNEIASFVFDLIANKSKEGYSDFRFWSDNCSSQNRNRKVFFMYVYACKKFNINVIKHTYLEKGHTQSEVDSVHATIEKATKNKIIYTPNEWNALIRWAKQTGEAYTVIDVTQEMIFDFKKMQSSPVYNWNKTTNGDQVKWSKIKQVMVSHDTPNTLSFKYDLAEDAPEYTIDINSKKTTRNTRLSKRPNVSDEPRLTKCYDGPLPITKEKKKDLMSMCSAKVIPAGYHDFFSNLISADRILDLSSDEE